MKSRYTITEISSGFTVTGKDRTPVTVELQGPAIVANGKEFGLYNYYGLSRYVAEELMKDWEPPDTSRLPKSENDEPYIPRWLRTWPQHQTAKAIGKRVHAQWKRLIGLADPHIVTVQRAIFAATRGSAKIATEDELYKDWWLVSDIVNYRAAAVAAQQVQDLMWIRWHLQKRRREKQLEESPQYAALMTLADSLGVNLTIDMSLVDRPGDFEPRANKECLEALHDWRTLFSPTGQSYRSLDRTLMNLPGGIPAGLLKHLAYIELERPVTNRLELLFMLHAVRYSGNDGMKENWCIVEHARAPQIKEAIRRVANFTHNELSHRRANDVKFLASFLADYPNRHNGNVVGWTDRAIAWHRDEQVQEIEKQVNLMGEDTKVAPPPIPLPEIPEITFLSDVRAVCEEGASMHHCVASYARNAVSGRCYLFHVERNGDRATVEVDYKGRVVQAHGPGNRRNNVATWAKQKLKAWGNGFPEDIELPQIVRLHNPELDLNVDRFPM
jgi:hypothetical protein